MDSLSQIVDRIYRIDKMNGSQHDRQRNSCDAAEAAGFELPYGFADRLPPMRFSAFRLILVGLFPACDHGFSLKLFGKRGAPGVFELLDGAIDDCCRRRS